MAGTSPRTPLILSTGLTHDEFVVSELAASEAGAHSPFGSDVLFPMPAEKVRYHHPRPQDRPNLAGA